MLMLDICNKHHRKSYNSYQQLKCTGKLNRGPSSPKSAPKILP